MENISTGLRTEVCIEHRQSVFGAERLELAGLSFGSKELKRANALHLSRA
jgi:hypothetical protein